MGGVLVLGLLVGMRASGETAPVHGICVPREASPQRARVERRAAELAAMERMLSPDGQLVQITLEGIAPAVDRSEGAGRGATRSICEPSKLPFRPETFDAIILGDSGRIDELAPLLKPAGVLSLIQAGGRGLGQAAHRRSQLSEAGLEVIDSPGMGFSYVINARRPIQSEHSE